MNPFKTDVSIQQDEVLGKAELIDPKNIDVILSSDSLFENQQSTRRIQLDKCSQKGDTLRLIILEIHRKMNARMCQMSPIICQICIVGQL